MPFLAYFGLFLGGKKKKKFYFLNKYYGTSNFGGALGRLIDIAYIPRISLFVKNHVLKNFFFDFQKKKKKIFDPPPKPPKSPKSQDFGILGKVKNFEIFENFFGGVQKSENFAKNLKVEKKKIQYEFFLQTLGYGRVGYQ